MARYYWTDREKQHCELWYSHVVDCAILICFFSVSIKNDSLGNICNIRHIEIVKYILSPIKVVPSKLKNFLFTQCLLAYCDAMSRAYFLILIIVDLTKASENLVNIVSALHWHWQHQAITRSTVDIRQLVFFSIYIPLYKHQTYVMGHCGSNMDRVASPLDFVDQHLHWKKYPSLCLV